MAALSSTVPESGALEPTGGIRIAVSEAVFALGARRALAIGRGLTASAAVRRETTEVAEDDPPSLEKQRPTAPATTTTLGVV